VLKILALESLHGWAISQRFETGLGDVLTVSEGSLLSGACTNWSKRDGSAPSGKPSESNRRAKFLFADAARPQASGKRSRELGSALVGRFASTSIGEA